MTVSECEIVKNRGTGIMIYDTEGSLFRTSKKKDLLSPIGQDKQ